MLRSHMNQLLYQAIRSSLFTSLFAHTQTVDSFNEEPQRSDVDDTHYGAECGHTYIEPV